jgi:hypothetical protein
LLLLRSDQGGGAEVNVFEGNRFGRLYKRCRCRSSASGPRILFKEQRRTLDEVEVDVMMVALACDECDVPWEESPTHDGMPHLREDS